MVAISHFYTLSTTCLRLHTLIISMAYAQGFDSDSIVPSASIGVEYPVTRYVTFYSSYRVSSEIHSINTDGVSVGVKVF